MAIATRDATLRISFTSRLNVAKIIFEGATDGRLTPSGNSEGRHRVGLSNQEAAVPAATKTAAKKAPAKKATKKATATKSAAKRTVASTSLERNAMWWTNSAAARNGP